MRTTVEVFFEPQQYFRNLVNINQFRESRRWPPSPPRIQNIRIKAALTHAAPAWLQPAPAAAVGGGSTRRVELTKLKAGLRAVGLSTKASVAELRVRLQASAARR